MTSVGALRTTGLLTRGLRAESRRLLSSSSSPEIEKDAEFDSDSNLRGFKGLPTLTFRRVQVKVLIVIDPRALLNVDAPLVPRAVRFRIDIAKHGSGSV